MAMINSAAGAKHFMKLYKAEERLLSRKQSPYVQPAWKFDDSVKTLQMRVFDNDAMHSKYLRNEITHATRLEF